MNLNDLHTNVAKNPSLDDTYDVTVIEVVSAVYIAGLQLVLSAWDAAFSLQLEQTITQFQFVAVVTNFEF